MKAFPTGKSPQGGAFFNKSERNRLLFLAALLVVVGVVFTGSLTQALKKSDRPNRELPEQQEFQEELVVPRFDASRIAGKVADAKAGDRVLLETGPFDALFQYARETGVVRLRTLDPQPLDAANYAELTAHPDAHRAEPYLARGVVEHLESRTRPDGLPEYRGWLRLESGEAAHFAVSSFPKDLLRDDFARIDGLFLKLYNDEGDSGWVEGPLLVGAGAVRSYPRLDAISAGRLQSALIQATDDTIAKQSGLGEETFGAHWLLMQHASELADGGIDWMLRPEQETLDALSDALKEPQKDALFEGGVNALKQQAVDWEAVPELDNRLLVKLVKEPERFRGWPFRLPVSRNMGTYTLDPGENPARLDRVTEGWIGNTTWTARAGLLKFQLPRTAPELADERYLMGRGYFLKDVGYEPKNGGLNFVPLFVMVSLEPFTPVEDHGVQNVLYGVAGIALLLFVLIPFLIFRDRRRAEALQRELVRRRQERRRRHDGGGAESAGQPTSP